MEEKKIGGKQKTRQKRMEQKRELLKSTECSRCHNPIPGLLQSSDFEPKRIEGEQVCDDCWYKEFGEGVEECPIGHPGR